MIDSHCHLNDEKIYPIRKQIIEEAKNAGVSTILVVGWDVASSKLAIEIANEFEGIYAAVGIHPENLDDISDTSIDEIRRLAKDPKVIAIGEIGLDYHWYKENEHREKQKIWFIKQIELANELNLPVSIHAREATKDVYDIIKTNPIKNSGVLHCYSGSKEMLMEFDKLGLYFGFDGPITYKNAIEPKENVVACPINKLLSETDSPYLSPVPYRGQTNSPKNIKEIVNAMAELRGTTVSTVEKAINENFARLFHVKQI